MNGHRLLLWCLGAMLPACAWARRENRPVWNAFEEHLVPQSQGAFLATLPLTVPVGLLSIAADTLVAHPLQVVDDAGLAAMYLSVADALFEEEPPGLENRRGVPELAGVAGVEPSIPVRMGKPPRVGYAPRMGGSK